MEKKREAKERDRRLVRAAFTVYRHRLYRHGIEAQDGSFGHDSEPHRVETTFPDLVIEDTAGEYVELLWYAGPGHDSQRVKFSADGSVVWNDTKIIAGFG